MVECRSVVDAKMMVMIMLARVEANGTRTVHVWIFVVFVEVWWCEQIFFLFNSGEYSKEYVLRILSGCGMIAGRNTIVFA